MKNSTKRTASKERSIGAVLRAPKFKTVKDYDNYINSLQEEAEVLQVKLVSLSTDIAAIRRKIEVITYEKHKKASEKVKKEAKKAGNKPS